jgi:hypothetical protein
MHIDSALLRRSACGLVTGKTVRRRSFRGQRGASAVMAVSVVAASIGLPPSAAADSADNLRNALLSARSSSCGPLRSNPAAEQTATIVNRSTDSYLDHTARALPVPDPLPVLKDLGYGGHKAVMLQGAGHTEAKAIKGALLEGFDALPDCSYTDYGVSLLHNATSEYMLTVAVLAGP